MALLCDLDEVESRLTGLIIVLSRWPGSGKPKGIDDCGHDVDVRWAQWRHAGPLWVANSDMRLFARKTWV